MATGRSNSLTKQTGEHSPEKIRFVSLSPFVQLSWRTIATSGTCSKCGLARPAEDVGDGLLSRCWKRPANTECWL